MSGGLDYNTLLQVLNAASSPLRGPEQQNAESQLKAWEAEKGFHYLLQSIYIDTQLSLQVRWLAVICLKNGVERFWRPTRINAITKEEKLEIRKRLFSTLGESNNQLAIQNAHLISKISRLDFPVEWPTLFEDIIQILESCSAQMNDPTTIVKLNNLMIISNQVLKILASVRIGKARMMMQAKAPLLFPHLVKFYTMFFERWLADNNFDVTIMEVGYLFLKNIRRLVVDGYEYQNRDKYVQEFMELSIQQFQKLLILHESNRLDLLERYIKCFVKLYFNLVRDKTCSFILLSCSKNILLTLLSLLQQKASLIYNLEIEADDSDFWEKIAIKSFIIMKTITNYVFKENRTNIVKQKNDRLEIEQSIELLKTSFFSLDLIENLINLITNWYLKLRPVDLENWENEPEDWFNEEASLDWEFQIRKCAENYFQDLSIHFSEFISQFIMNKIENLNTGQLDSITKDSILSIFELSSNSISKSCNFNQLLIEYFIPQALSTDNSLNSKLIKRRVCLIINEWLDVKIEPNVRIEIYKFLLTLVSEPENDKVVKLTSIQTLKYMLDDWEFRKGDFRPFIDENVKHLLMVLDSLETIESKIFTLNTMSLLLERTNPLIDEKVLIEIVTVVPILWQKSNNSNEMIIKNSLLRILKDLIMSLNENSNLIHDIVVPLIPICCDSKSEYYSLLCEDGLELWSSIMKTLPSKEVSATSKLFDPILLEILVNCLINWTEILPLILGIIRSYFLISADIFNNEAGFKIFEVLKGYLKTMRDDSVFLTSSILEIAILEKNAGNKEFFYSNLIKSGLFAEVVEYLIRDTDSPYCEIKVSLPLLRMIIDTPILVISNIGNASVLNRLLGNLCRFAKNSFDPKVRKLFLLGLLSLYQVEGLQKESLVIIPPSKIDDLDELDYELEKLDKETGISAVLVLFFKRIVDLSLSFVEEIRELPSGDLKAYHKQTSYDDTDLQPYEPGYDENAEEQDQEEYALENDVPPTAERLRYTQLLQNFDPVRRVFFRDALRGTVERVYGHIGGSLPPELVEELKHVCA
ncbi:hypothetical protein PICMEDRAFT_18571 [Pichia membranifaciens NRRL Y-2026]|uniref:Importin N-terminal domain-containing protein n=1 Tax=Pichia membranifaciens NRRL Y-2026 TaxID=763406 RepID=A0A1E3NDD6_9ASCO|nr:hypothetical protein PICMEDRAFT_18571 [Pichia membranifaciens NRRL Y-2026]ODQ44116.1 hypothetical protein PICMEDRAFT_18571 [Pichia membranifaciens NRRL Y-2026]